MLKIGHRGACGYVPENTIESIEKAIALGVDGVEIDIFKCKSGELVLFHDQTLNNLVGRSERIEELTLTELNECLIMNKYSIPTLKKVLETVKPPLFINIELKGSGTALPTSDLLYDFTLKKKWSESSFIVSSFQTFCRLTCGRNWMSTTSSFTLTTTVWVIHWVFYNTSSMRFST